LSFFTIEPVLVGATVNFGITFKILVAFFSTLEPSSFFNIISILYSHSSFGAKNSHL